ncbi:MAG TPA: class I SAM-dependent methyltransferase [Pirellulales bacterium]|jgi:2-polyprenyl-3-methyl-5-hydroxy-6-metoxy-1,4-benzoquinol methylase|nr:class I SAM-dependent methyltransferase [Pirellulales bacterium]
MNCRVCDSTRLDPAVDLGVQPWCNHFLRADELGREPLYPLRVVFCQDCSTAQLDFTVKKEIMFGDHTYLSGVTRSLGEHFGRIAREVDQRFVGARRPRAVLDIGSNDGTQLMQFRDLGYDVLGIESSKTTARLANEAGIATLNEFFNLEVARRLGRKFDVINAAGVFFHLEELHSVTDGIRECLGDDGVFVVQFLYMKRIVENLAFDQIYHEHLLYYNLATIEVLLERHGLSMFDAYLAPIHGGSIIGFVTHRGLRPTSLRLDQLRAAEERDESNELATYHEFARRIARMKAENLAYLDDAKRLGKTIFGMGAPVKGNTLLNYFGIGTQYLDCLVEKNELRRGLFSPGRHVPVVIERELAAPPDIYYVLAWNFKQEILANNRDLIDRGVEFYFPVNPTDVCV